MMKKPHHPLQSDLHHLIEVWVVHVRTMLPESEFVFEGLRPARWLSGSNRTRHPFRWAGGDARANEHWLALAIPVGT